MPKSNDNANNSRYEGFYHYYSVDGGMMKRLQLTAGGMEKPENAGWRRPSGAPRARPYFV
jgi:hypothetical protein